MRTVKLLLALGVAMLLGGCILVPSIHPLYTEKDLVFDTALVGTWSGSDSECEQTWDFKKAEEGKAYDLTITSEGEAVYFKAHLVKLGATTLLDTYPKATGSTKDLYYLCHIVPAHIFSKVERDGDELHIAMLSCDWLDARLKEKKVTIAHECVEDGVILTAPTKELQKFAQKYADDARAFGTITKLHRKK